MFLCLGLWRCLYRAVLFEVRNLLEVSGTDQRLELLDGNLDVIVDQSIREEHGVIRYLDLIDRQINTLLEILLSFDSVADLFAQLLEVRRVNEQEISLDALLVDLEGSGSVHLDNRDLARLVDAD